MKYIVGDIGNTSTRICLLNNKNSILKSGIYETKKLFQKNYLRKIINKFLIKNTNKNILLSSVVPLLFKNFKNLLKNTEYKVTEVKSLRLNKVIKIKYDFHSNLSQIKNKC